MRTSTKILLLAGIMILASFLRLYHITSTPPGLYPDEAMDGNNALEIVHGGQFQTFYTEDNGREGLYVNILVFAIKAFGNKPWVVRLPAAIAGILTVLGLYFLVRELFDDGDEHEGLASRSAEAIALLAAFLLATSFWHINFSRIGFRAILAPLCLIGALYFLIKAMKISLSPVSCSSFLVLAGICFGFGFYTYIAYRITPLLLLLFIPFFRKYPDFWKKMLLFLAATFIVALPIGVYFLQHPADFFGRTSQISVTNSANPLREFTINVGKTLLMFNVHGDNNWRQNIAGAPELFWPVGILFLIGILWSIYYLWPRSAARSWAFGLCLNFAWFFLALLPAAISDEGIPHALRSILILPPAIIFAALGGVWLFQTAWNRNPESWIRAIIKITAGLFITAVAVNAYQSYFVTWAQNPNVPGAFNADYVALGDQINALPSSTPKYVVVEAGGVLARGIPVPAETVMFVTDSFTTSTQEARHITYLLPNETNQIPTGTPSSTIFYLK